MTRSVREPSQPKGLLSRVGRRPGLVVGWGVESPGVEVLTHGGQHHVKEPTWTARQAGVVEAEVELFAFDGAFGTRASIRVELPER